VAVCHHALAGAGAYGGRTKAGDSSTACSERNSLADTRGNGYVADKLWMMTKAAQLNCFIFKKTLDGTLEQQGYLVADWLTSDTTQQPRDRSHFAAILLFGEGRAGDGPICRNPQSTHMLNRHEVARISKLEYQAPCSRFDANSVVGYSWTFPCFFAFAVLLILCIFNKELSRDIATGWVIGLKTELYIRAYYSH